MNIKKRHGYCHAYFKSVNGTLVRQGLCFVGSSDRKRSTTYKQPLWITNGGQILLPGEIFFRSVTGVHARKRFAV